MKHPACPETNKFKIAANGMDLVASEVGISAREYHVRLYDDKGEVDHLYPDKWSIFEHIDLLKPQITRRYSLARVFTDDPRKDRHCFCYAPDTEKEDTYLLIFHTDDDE